ncbi:MAG: stage III sporulation protein AF [Lachnospiraceae bacterium]
MADAFFLIIKRVGIFVVIAQTLLHFRPNETYEKYMRVLCNVMILSMLVLPILELSGKDIMTEYNQAIEQYEHEMEQLEQAGMPVDTSEASSYDAVIESMEKEIKSRLNNEITGREVEQVVLIGIEADGTSQSKNARIVVFLTPVQTDRNIKDSRVKKIKIEEQSSQNERIQQMDSIQQIQTTQEISQYQEQIAKILGVEKTYVEVALHD